MSLVTYVGGAESNSFVSVAEAEEYFETIEADRATWDEYSLGEKEFRLALAAQMLGHLPLRGRTVFRTQALCFPRSCQPYSGRFKIPPEVKQAQALIALQIIPPEVTSLTTAGDTSWGTPTSVSIGGLLSASFGAKQQATSILERFTSQVPFPVYMLMKKFIAQIRGRVVHNLDQETYTLSTTTSHAPVTTTTALPVTTTTSA